jgi:cytochrome c2
MLDDDYTVTPNVSAPDWFVESAAMWMRGMMDDDSFNDAILFLAENRLL